MNKGKLSMQTKLCYGFGQFGEGLAYNMFYFYYTYFMTTVVGISPAIAGSISALAVIWDAVTDPLIGFISDDSRSRQGRRRSMMMKGVLPLAISLCVLYLDLPVSMNTRLIIAFVANIIFWVAFTMCDVPWLSLGSELTDDMNESDKLRTISTICLYAGNMCVTGFSLTAVTLIGSHLSNPGLAWGIWAGIVGLLSAVAFAIPVFATKKHDQPLPEDMPKQKFTEFVPELIGCLKIKYYMPVVLVGLIMTTVYGIYSSGSVYLMTYVYNFSEGIQGSMNVIGVILALGLTLLMGSLTARYDKHVMFIVTGVVGVIFFAISLFVPATMTGYIFFLLAYAFGNAAFWLFIFALAGDVATVDRLETGKERAGLMIAVVNFMTKLGTAIGMWFIGICLEMIGFDIEAEVQTLQVQNAMRPAVVIPLAILTILNCIVLKYYKLDRKTYQGILDKHGVKL